MHYPHALSATARSRLKHDRESQGARLQIQVRDILLRSVIARENRNARADHARLGGDLGSQNGDRFRSRAHKLESGLPGRPGKLSVFRQEAITRVDRLHLLSVRRFQNPPRIKVAFASVGSPKSHRHVRFPHMLCTAIGVGIDGHCPNTQTARRAENSTGNLAAVCNQE